MKHSRAGLFTALIVPIMLLIPKISFGAEPGATAVPLPVDPEFKPRSGTYYYTVDFNNMNIGTASIGIDNENDLYKVQVHARTIGMVDRIYRLRYQGEAVMDTDPVSPMKLQVQQDVRSTEKVISMNFQHNGAIRTTETKSLNGDAVDYTVRNVHTDKFTLDPLSATYLVRGLDWEVGIEKVFDVYPGKHQYEVRLRCIGKESLVFAGGKREAWVIVPRVTNLDPEKRAAAAKKKPADVKIYVSTDGLRDVLKVEARHTLGQFLARMERFEPSAIRSKEEHPGKTQIQTEDND